MNQMNKKFKYQQYQICTSFRNQNCLSISAEHLPTQQIFLKDDAELTRIKKDTVFATLDRKSENNLRCELEQIIFEGKKYLIISFIVNFDYLPEFKEEIKLEFVEKKEKLKSISVNNFHGEIQEMEKMLNSFQKNGLSLHNQAPSAVNFSAGKDLLTQFIASGKYLLRFSGIYTNTSGGGPCTDQIVFKLEIPGNQSKKITCTAFSQYGYPYPISFSEIVQPVTDGEFKANISTTIPNCSLTGANFFLSPVFEMA